MKQRLLEAMTANGLINRHVDGIKQTSHIASAELAEAITRKALV